MSEVGSVAKKEFQVINITAFVSVALAAVLLGFVAHEVFHLLAISEVSSLTVHFGDAKSALSTCCLSEGESALEEIAYFIQFVVTLGWIMANSRVFLEG